MRKENSRNDLGTIRIHKNVIASIASIAAMEVEGVKHIGTNLKSSIFELLGKRDISAIKVEIDKNGEVTADVPIVIKYGVNIPETADRVQENIHKSLEKMTNLSIRNINVNVQGIEKS